MWPLMDKLQAKTVRTRVGKTNKKEDKTRSKEQDTTEEESPLIQALCLRSTELVGQVRRTKRLSLLLDALDLAMSKIGRQEKGGKAGRRGTSVEENEVTRSHAVSRATWTLLERQAGHPLPQNEGGSMPATEGQKKTEEAKRNERRAEDKVRHDIVGTSQHCAAEADGAVPVEGETSDARSRLVGAIRRLMAVLRRRRKRKENTAAKRVQSVFRRIMARGETGNRKQVRVWRSVTVPRCLWGQRLAKQADFDRQKKEADAIQNHWEQYMHIFFRLEKTNVIVGDLCSSEGGQVDGIEDLPHCEHRACDILESPKYVEAYGRDRLTVGDATLEETLRRMGPVHLYTASPPCQGTSRMPKAGGGDYRVQGAEVATGNEGGFAKNRQAFLYGKPVGSLSGRAYAERPAADQPRLWTPSIPSALLRVYGEAAEGHGQQVVDQAVLLGTKEQSSPT